jgi:hypothetical protein
MIDTSTPRFAARTNAFLATVAGPLVADAGAAREADATVDDEDAPVIPVVDPRDRQRVERVIAGHMAAGLLHQLPILARHARAADGVEQHVDADARAAALRERVGHVARDVAFLVDEAGERDRRLRVADRGEHRREDLVAVQQHLCAVALHELRVRVRLDGADARQSTPVPSRVHALRTRVPEGQGTCQRV